MYIGYKSLVRYIICGYFILFYCLFNFLMVSFDAQNFIIFLKFILSFLFCHLNIWDCNKKTVVQPKVTKICFCFTFAVLALTLRTIVHFELTFVDGTREGSKFILLHGDSSLSQNHLLIKLFFPNCIILAHLLKIS